MLFLILDGCCEVDFFVDVCCLYFDRFFVDGCGNDLKFVGGLFECGVFCCFVN